MLSLEEWDIESRLGCCAVGGEPTGERVEECTRSEKSSGTRLQAVRQLGRLSLEKAVELRMQEFLTDRCKDKNGMFCMAVVHQMRNNGLRFQQGR